MTGNLFQFDNGDLLWAAGFFVLGVVAGIRVAVWWYAKSAQVDRLVSEGLAQVEVERRTSLPGMFDDEPELPHKPPAPSPRVGISKRVMECSNWNECRHIIGVGEPVFAFDADEIYCPPCGAAAVRASREDFPAGVERPPVPPAGTLSNRLAGGPW